MSLNRLRNLEREIRGLVGPTLAEVLFGFIGLITERRPTAGRPAEDARQDVVDSLKCRLLT